MPECYFSFAKLTIRLTRRGGGLEFQKLTGVVLDVSFDAKKLRSHVKTVQDYECLAAEKTHHTLSREGFQKKKLRKACESPDAHAFLYKKNTLDVLPQQTL